MEVIMVDSKLMIGDIKEINGDKVILVKNWNLDLFEDFSETVEVDNYAQVSFGKRVSKLFSKPQLLDYWDELIEETYDEETNELQGDY